jgi:hypothetical protein
LATGRVSALVVGCAVGSVIKPDVPDGQRDEGGLGREGEAAGASLGECHADGPRAHHASNSNSHREGTGARWVSDHVEEAGALLDKPGAVRLEEGAPEVGGEGGEGAEGLSGNSAMAGTERGQVTETAIGSKSGSGGG